MCPIVTLDDGEVRDEIRQPIYDTVDLLGAAALAGQYLFFQNLTAPPAAGGANVPKSLAKTNMGILGANAGSLAVATSFRVQGLCLDADNRNTDGSMAQVLPIILTRGSINFAVGQKNYWQGPARFVTGRQDVFSDGLTFLHQQYGWASIQPVVLRGHHVIDINSLQNFLVTLRVDAQDLTAAEAAITTSAGSDTSLVFSLKGLLRRPVQ